MGVPKFYRYISERYPCLSELVNEYQISEFDNLYLDMNGIVHMCSHPDDNNLSNLSEEKIFADIFHYTEVLFRIIKPLKVFFIAIDGVAPRAKMNQQRGRRFRTAKYAEKMCKEAKERGEPLPEDIFDPNCITPGTVFMAKLQEQLKYFIVKKISTDSLWQRCKVILSGHETPGEGEHKIMDYIRYMRAQPGYDPNTRHCLYGLDADLIMLGMCTHEPHFSLLREEVKFGKRNDSKRRSVPENTNFFLLQLSLLREYIDLEFQTLKSKLPFPYDLEKIIDDWVLISFLVGNDFIPNLPNVNIHSGILPVLYNTYMNILPKMDGYMNENGFLNLARFEIYMEALREIDLDNFSEQYSDIKYFEAKTGRRPNETERTSYKPRELEKWEDELADHKQYEPLEAEPAKKPMKPDLAALIQATEDMFLDSPEDKEDYNEDSSSDEGDLFEAEFKQHKKDYYMNKLEYTQVTPDVLRSQAEGYIKAIQWNLHYYYNGCCSWSWFYPHHYAPFVSDIRNFKDTILEYDLGKPFHPFEQLLSVLPPACKKLLPECYHNLMVDDESVIKDYYPNDFSLDLNGKKQDWEAVVLIPFINEKRLLDAMKPCNEQLNEEELKRNSHGPFLEYEYCSKDLGTYEAPAYFPPIKSSHAKATQRWNKDISVPVDKLVKGAYPGTLKDVYYSGFPTMKHLKFSCHLRKAGVKVFDQPSRGENMLLIIQESTDTEDLKALAENLIGRSVFVAWPHLTEALVESVSTANTRFLKTESGLEIEATKGSMAGQVWQSRKNSIEEHYMNRFGVDVGATKILVHVKTMKGRKYVFSSQGRITLEKQWTDAVSVYPFQTIVRDINVHNPKYKNYRDIEEFFNPGSKCFMLGLPHYGHEGTVQNSKDVVVKDRLRVALKVYPEPDLVTVYHCEKNFKVHYLTLNDAALCLGIGRQTFSQITGTVLVVMGVADSILVSEATSKINIGLNLKFNRRNEEVPGYTKRDNGYWYYSHRAVELVKEYINNFPEVFAKIPQRAPGADYYEWQLFPEDKGSGQSVRKIAEWIKKQPFTKIERVPCGTQAASPDAIQELEKVIDSYNETKKASTVTVQVKPFLLYKPGLQMGNIVPDPKSTYQLFDRVVNVRDSYTVPFGLSGTIIKVYNVASTKPEDQQFDVLFDEPFAGGMVLNCSEGRGYKVPAQALINRSYGIRYMESKTGKPGQLMSKYQSHSQSNDRFNIHQQHHHRSVQPPSVNSAFAWCNKSSPARNSRAAEFSNTNNAHQMNRPTTRPQPPQAQPQPPPPQPQVPKPQQPHPPQQQSIRTDFMPPFPNNLSPQKKITILNRPENSHPLEGFKISVQDVFAHASQRLQAQQRFLAPQPPPQPPARPSYCLNLMTFYRMQGLGCPFYQYFCDPESKLVMAQITLPNSKEVVMGGFAPNKEQASEMVAEIVYNRLTRGSFPEPPRVFNPPPIHFPPPPQQWRQQPQNRASPMENQQQLSGCDASLARTNAVPNDSSSRVKGYVHQGSKPFVPLQAARQLRANKSQGSERQTNRTEKVDSQNRGFNDKGKPENSDCNSDEREAFKPKRERKMRLAANFSKN